MRKSKMYKNEEKEKIEHGTGTTCSPTRRRKSWLARSRKRAVHAGHAPWSRMAGGGGVMRTAQGDARASFRRPLSSSGNEAEPTLPVVEAASRAVHIPGGAASRAVRILWGAAAASTTTASGHDARGGTDATRMERAAAQHVPAADHVRVARESTAAVVRPGVVRGRAPGVRLRHGSTCRLWTSRRSGPLRSRRGACGRAKRWKRPRGLARGRGRRRRRGVQLQGWCSATWRARHLRRGTAPGPRRRQRRRRAPITPCRRRLSSVLQRRERWRRAKRRRCRGPDEVAQRSSACWGVARPTAGVKVSMRRALGPTAETRATSTMTSR